MKTRGPHTCMHGFSKPKSRSRKLDETSDKDHFKSINQWKSREDDRIPCPPKTLGGCGEGILKLNRTLQKDFVSSLLLAAEEV